MRSLLASSIMPRTTLDLDGSVLSELRRRGRRDGKSMGRLASELLAEALAREETPPPAPFKLRTAKLGRPLVDLEDKDAVQAILDEEE
jgi:plasmid stability protein